MQRRRPLSAAAWQYPPVHLDTKVDADRPDGRSVPDAEAERPSELAQIHVIDVLEHVAGVHEHDGPKASADRYPQLGVEDREPVPAGRKPARVEGAQPVEGEAAHGRISPGVKALAGRDVFHNRRLGLPWLNHEAGKSGPHPEARAERA